MTYEERCLLIRDVAQFVNQEMETGRVIGSNVWYDLAFCLLPALALGKPVCFRPRMKLLAILRTKPDLWLQVSEFVVTTEAAEPLYERKRILGATYTDLTAYKERIAAAGGPCDN